VEIQNSMVADIHSEGRMLTEAARLRSTPGYNPVSVANCHVPDANELREGLVNLCFGVHLASQQGNAVRTTTAEWRQARRLKMMRI